MEIVEISSPGLANEELEGVTLAVLSLVVTVEGDEEADLIDFIVAWTEEYPTGVVESVEITVPEPPEDEEETAEELTSADIRLLIYTYEGD